MISKIINSEEASDNEEQEKVSKDVYLIAQEIKIVKSLASNDLIQRTRQIKKLRKWLSLRSNSTTPFEQEDFLRIWKGLFYCMWMSDKPLVQESLAEDFGSLLDCFTDPKVSAEFFAAFLKTMSLEWFGIDQWRIDKFLMLVRRMLRHIFQVFKTANWSPKNLKYFNKQISNTILTQHEAIGLTMHFIDIYLEELAKVSDGTISDSSVVILVKPFTKYLAVQRDMKMLSHLRNNIFYHLLWQSDLGREYTEKFNAWKMMGFPTANIDDLEKVEEASADENEASDAEEENGDSEPKEKILDPRAGKVDVEIPEMPVNVEPLIKELESLLLEDITNTKSRRCIRQIVDKYNRFKSGYFPLGVKSIAKPDLPSKAELVKKKVEELDEFQENLLSTTRKLKQLSKKKRKRLLASINIDETVNEENFEEMLDTVIQSKKTKLSNGWEEEDIIAEPDQDNDMTNCKVERSDNVKNKKSSNTPKKLKKQNSIQKSPANKENRLSEVSGITKSKKTEFDTSDTKPQKKKKIEKKNQSKILAKEDCAKQSNGVESPTPQKTSPKQNKINKRKSIESKWDEPLKEGEYEYVVKSKKSLIKDANKTLELLDNQQKDSSNLVINPFAKKKKMSGSKNNLLNKVLKSSHNSSADLMTPKKAKKVKIVLQKNMAQNPHEYIQQVRLSPNVPYDSKKQPSKSLLKPNLMPSPINPFYMKKLGIKIGK